MRAVATIPFVLFAQSAQQRLPVRDGDVLLYAVAGLFLLAVGGLMIFVARRRAGRQEPPDGS